MGARDARTSSTRWDAVVVGAGPAGSLAAGELARRGVRVLLVDRARFPRDKACGGCLMPAALAALDAAGAGHVPRERGAVPLARMELVAGGRRAALPLPGGVALSRRTLDAALADEAVRRGAVFRDGTRADPGEPAARGGRTLVLHTSGSPAERVYARVVLAADGLAGRTLGGVRHVARRSRIGAGAVLDAQALPLDEAVLVMYCGAGGYVGLVRAEQGRVLAAAALEPRLVRDRGGIGAAVAALLAEASAPAQTGRARCPAAEHTGAVLARATWRGTPPLTHRPARPWAPGVLALGDSAGYVEPFTGEGMAWALAAARAVVSPALRAIDAGWSADLGREWERTHRRLLRGRRTWCGLLARALRHPRLVHVVTAVLARTPSLATPLVRYTVPVPRVGAGAHARAPTPTRARAGVL